MAKLKHSAYEEFLADLDKRDADKKAAQEEAEQEAYLQEFYTDLNERDAAAEVAGAVAEVALGD